MAKAKRRNWYDIRAQADDEVDVYIYGDIVSNGWFETDVEAQRFVKEFAAIEASRINVRVNSFGGEVFAAVAIHGAIQRHPAEVIAHIDGVAASAASVIVLAADQVRIAQGAFYMIHNGWGWAMGNKDEIRRYADLLEKTDGVITDYYERKSGQPREQIEEWMNAETWFTADEAFEAGFVDAVEDAEPVQAKGDLSRFKRVPAALRRREEPAQRGERRTVESERDLEALLRDEGGLSHAAAKKIAAGGYKALVGPRDEDERTPEASSEVPEQDHVDALCAALFSARLELEISTLQEA